MDRPKVKEMEGSLGDSRYTYQQDITKASVVRTRPQHYLIIAEMNRVKNALTSLSNLIADLEGQEGMPDDSVDYAEVSLFEFLRWGGSAVGMLADQLILMIELLKEKLT